jgi:hypothetical protein
MNARLLAAFLCLVAASTGCVIVNEPAVPGNVTFIWSFSVGGGRCSDVPDIQKVRIVIPGEMLHNDGIYACTTAGVDGIILHDFQPGLYTYTLEALDYSNQVRYRGSGTFRVNGNVRLTPTLTPVGNPSGFTYISWYFPPNTHSTNPTCQQAGVARVDVRIGNGEWGQFDCGQGIGGNQVQTPYLAPGQYSIEFVGVGSNGSPYYYFSSTLQVQAGSPAANSYRLLEVGSMALRWELFDGGTLRTCAQAGVTQVTINLQDTFSGEFVYGNTGDLQSCTGAPIIYRFLRPGTYRVFIRGLDASGNVRYTNEYATPVTQQVVAFQQKTENEAFTVFLYR